MTQVNKIDSNSTGLRYAEETTYNTEPVSATWNVLEPNEYDDFGGELTLIARNPINSSRQRKKGVVTDLDASGGFETDLTQTNLTDLMQGFFFADIAGPGEFFGADATVTTDIFTMSDTTGFFVGQRVYASGYVNAANNGFHIISAVVSNTSIAVTTSSLVSETATTAMRIVGVGAVLTAGSGVCAVDASGTFPTLTINNSVVAGWDEVGVEAGDWIYIGGDAANTSFTGSTANNGFKRIRSIDATNLIATIDKSQSTMVTDDGSDTGSAGTFDNNIHIYSARKLKNRQSTDIIRRTYWLERDIGARDDAEPSLHQYEYVSGAVPSELEIQIPVADKIMANVSFMGASTVRRDTSTGGGDSRADTGTPVRPTLVDADAFNTSSDISRIRLATYDGTTEAPTALFTYAEEITISLNNNLNPLKAVGTLGSFDVSAGTFEVSGEITAYFADTASIDAVQNNEDITLDMAIVKSNAGLVIDMPLIALGEGRLEVEQDEAIKIPLDAQAATGAKLHTDLDYTLYMGFFGYLPTVAETTP